MLGLRNAVAAVVLIGASGCDDTLIKTVSGFTDRMCACEDAACANEVQNAFLTWAKEQRDFKPTDDQMRRLMPLVDRYTACWTARVPRKERDKTPLPDLPAEMPEGGLPAEAPAD